MASVSFDPTKPFEVLSEPSRSDAPTFDPAKPFEVVSKTGYEPGAPDPDGGMSFGDNTRSFTEPRAEYIGKSAVAGVKSVLGDGLGLAAGIYNNLFGLSDDELTVLSGPKGDGSLTKEGVEKFKSVNPGSYLESGSKALLASGRETTDSLSEGAKQFANKEYLTTDPSKAAYLSPTKMIGDVLNSLPSTVMLALSARFGGNAATVARAEALAAGATEAAANKAAVDAATKVITRVGAAGEGSLGYEQQYDSTRDKVMAMSPEKLSASPEYQDLIKQGYDADKAKQLLAGRAGNMAGFVAGIVDAGTNLVSGRVLGHVIGEGGNSLARTAKAFGAESAEEGVQSAGEQLGENYAVKQTADPSQDLGEGVAESAAQGAVIGGLTGAGVGVAAGEHGVGGNEGPAPVDPNNPAPAPSSDAPAAAAPAAGVAAAPAIEAALPAEAVTPQQKVSVDQVLGASDVDTAISAAAEAAVASPTGAPRASLDQIIDETKKSLDANLPNPQQQKLEKLFGGFNTGTVQKAKDGMMEYRTAEGATFPLQIWEPDPKNPGAGGISPELAAAQIQHYKDVGIDVVYIRDDKNIPFDGVVDASQPNTIFLSSNPTRNAAQVGQHEVTHVFENTMLPDGTSLADIMQQQIAEGITNEGIEHAANLFGETAPDRTSYPNTPEGQAAHADAVLVHLFNELGADIGGEAPKFEGFIQKVMDAVETRYGGGVASQTFQKFMNGIREAITTLRKFFNGETQSQKWVNNLEKVHTTLAQMYAAKYGEVAKLQDPITPENVITEALVNKEANPTRAGPAPREGYDTAKKQAEVYKRWLGELDETRRTNAQKSPEVGMLRAEEKTIVGKVKDEKYLTKAARSRLEKVRAEIEARVNPKEDDNDMALVRAKMVEAHGRMADAAAVPKKEAKKPVAAAPVKNKPTSKETGNPADEDRFVANQMAQDAGVSARFSPKVEEKQPVFFSALERAVDGVKFDKAPPGQWMATIKNMPGIKADEIKTTDIEKWLNAQTGPVTKAEVLEQLELGAVKIEEIMHGGGELTRDVERQPNGEWAVLDSDGGIVEIYETEAGAENAARTTDTKFDQYALPGGKNYRELLMALPAKEGPASKAWQSEIARLKDKYGDSFYTAARSDEREKLNSLHRAAGNGAGDPGLNFKSSHWDEPNVLAHVRFDDRVTSADGTSYTPPERTLHIAEIQSDWHQKGRKTGYQGAADLAALEEAGRKATDAMYKTRARLIKEATNGEYTSKKEALDAGDKAAFQKIVLVDANPEMLDAIERHEGAIEKLRMARTAVPDAPFKTTWHELAMKRMLRYAAENGYDRISWDTGITNADRYDLSQTVEKMEWTKLQNGRVFMEIYDHDEEKVIDQSYELSKLPDVVGKEITDRIAAQIETGKTKGTIEGEGLKVGGAGMRGFYDKILPDFMNKYTKKWGGKVEASTIKGVQETAVSGEIVMDALGIPKAQQSAYWRDLDQEQRDSMMDAYRKRDAVAPVHSLEITPAMRAAVMQGQPKFSPKAKPTVKELTKETPGLKKVVSNLTPEEIKDVSARTADKLVKLFSNLPSSEETAAVAYSGRAKRGWYQHSAQAIVDVFGQADGSRFASLLAALSPQTSVESNLENALRMWVNWEKVGRPTDAKTIGKLMGESVQGTGGEASVLDAWRGNTIRALTDADPGRPDFMLSGPKVNSFAKNLRNEVNEVTNDAWMATYAAIEPEMLAARRLENKVDNVGKSFGFKSPGYTAMSAMVRDAAKILTRKTGQTWTPAEVQETVWSWAKTLYERRDRAGENRTTQQILKAADMTHEDVTSTPDFAVLLTRGLYRKILEGGNYGAAISNLEKSGGGDNAAGRPSGAAVSVTGAEGSGFAQAAFERHLQRAAARLERVRTDRLTASGVSPRDLIADARDSEIAANMSAATNSIPGIAQLAAAANAGDESAARLVNLIAHESLERLVATVPDAQLEVSRNGGLYGGALEPSLGVKITFPEKRRAGVLAALAKFAGNFNQEQIHVRQPTIDPVGRVYTDGSYATPVYSFELEEPLSREAIEQVIAESGLYGLNFSDKKLEAYYVGDPRDASSRAEFSAAIERARGALGERARRIELSTARLWAYGIGEGAVAGYDAIAGDVPRGTSEHTEVPRALAERELGREIDLADQADEITDAQRTLQSKIADHYEQLPDNDMANPEVRRAYEELSKVIQKQFDALPVKVDVWNREGEPYKTSADMRRDVLDNNHMWIFGTSTDTFGPPGTDFRGHPLLELTGRESNNGFPLVVNDELRAVHDYYAHMLSPATFGPRGEEAAWKNHLATIDNPWARWALTSETRGQNSWVNFGAHVDPSSKLSERPFARQKAALLPMEHMLTGNDAIDGPTYEFMRTMPDFVKNGSLPRSVNDPFADFSPRVPSQLREKLIRKDPAYRAMFNDNLPKKQIAFPATPAVEAKPAPVAAPVVVEAKPAPVAAPVVVEGEKPPRRRALQAIEGTGREETRAINGAVYNVGEEQPQMDRAARLVAEDPDRALAIAMREVNPPAGVHPEFVFMAMEEAAQISGDVALQERLSRSRIAEEATTMGQRIAAWRNRAEISPVEDMRRIREAREAAAKARGVDPQAQIDKVVEQGITASRKAAKSTKRPNMNDFIMSIVCKT